MRYWGAKIVQRLLTSSKASSISSVLAPRWKGGGDSTILPVQLMYPNFMESLPPSTFRTASFLKLLLEEAKCRPVGTRGRCMLCGGFANRLGVAPGDRTSRGQNTSRLRCTALKCLSTRLRRWFIQSAERVRCSISHFLISSCKFRSQDASVTCRIDYWKQAHRSYSTPLAVAFEKVAA